MPYLNINTNDYPRYDGDLELLGWKLGDPLPEDWVEVIQDPTPVVAEDEIYVIQVPQLVNGVWKATWLIRKMTAEEIELKNTPEISIIDPLNLFDKLNQ